MANKRQRKKLQQKENIDKLIAVGANKEEIKKNKNKTQQVDSVYKKYTYQQKRNEIANYRSGILKEMGYKLDRENAKKRYWGEKRWNEWLANEQKKLKRVENKKQKSVSDEYYLLLFWRDKVRDSHVDETYVKAFKKEYRFMTVESLIETINFYLRDPDAKGTEIGKAEAAIIHHSQVDDYIWFKTHISKQSNLLTDIHDWQLVYKGKVKRYKDLLLAIVTTIILMYDNSERSDFINNLLDKILPQINSNFRERLVKDLNWRDF